jgi:hypothetical protein
MARSCLATIGRMSRSRPEKYRILAILASACLRMHLDTIIAL